MLHCGDSLFGTARAPVGEILKHLRRIGKAPAAYDLTDCPSRLADSDTHAVAYRNGKRRQERRARELARQPFPPPRQDLRGFRECREARRVKDVARAPWRRARNPNDQVPIPSPDKEKAGPKSGFRGSFRGLEAVGHVRDADAVADDVLRDAHRGRGAAVVGGGDVPRYRARGDGDYP